MRHGLLLLAILTACQPADTGSDQSADVDTSGSPDPGGPPIDEPTNEAAEAEPEAQPVLPVPFLGRWAHEIDDCGGRPGLDRIIIGASEIQFPDANAEPLSVLQLSDNGIIIDLRITARGGASTLRRDRLVVDPDGNSMVYSRGGDARRYDRCPV